MASDAKPFLSFTSYVERSVEVLRDLPSEAFQDCFIKAKNLLVETLSSQKPVLVCGNGGSASDAQHFTAELVGRYKKNRRAFPVICLSGNAAILTALGNDYGYASVFSRQVEAYGEKGGLLIGLSTSGKSLNIIQAFEKARQMGLKTIAMTGQFDGPLVSLSDVCLQVPSEDTPLIQQAHLVIYHFLCECIEAECV